MAVTSRSTCPESAVKDQPVETCSHAIIQARDSWSDSSQNSCNNLAHEAMMHDIMLARSGVQSVGNKKLEPQHNYPISQHSPGKDCGTVSCDPPPKGPHGYFIPAPYHPEHPTPGCKSTGPSWHDGQKALDASVEVENESDGEKKQRVVVYGGKYIVLDQTSSGVYHGHHRPWKKQGTMQGLTPEMKKSLKKAEIVKDNGKVLKDAKK